MLAAKHLERGRELAESLRRLRPRPGDVAAAVELAHGAAHQLAAAWLLRHRKEHHDKHQAIAAALDRHRQHAAADAFRELSILRAGRWYGGQGNGEVVRRCLELLHRFEALARSL